MSGGHASVTIPAALLGIHVVVVDGVRVSYETHTMNGQTAAWLQTEPQGPAGAGGVTASVAMGLLFVAPPTEAQIQEAAAAMVVALRVAQKVTGGT